MPPRQLPYPDDLPRAKRALGQNFLIDPNVQRKIVAALDPGPDDEVLEIGPGVGALTRHLAGRVRRLFERMGEAGSVPPDDRTALLVRF